MATQHGVVSRSQARRSGVSRRVERRLLRDGILAEPAPGVLALAGSHPTFHGRALAATLAPGIVAVSHGAAARLHGLDGFATHDVVDVLAGAGAHHPGGPGVAVHRSRAIVEGHVRVVDGIRVLDVTATLALLAPVAGLDATALALDSALAAGIGASELRATAEAWRRRGRAGPVALLALLSERAPAPRRAPARASRRRPTTGPCRGPAPRT